MKILAIETSCDETAIALLNITGPLEKPEINVLGNSLLSQVALHEQYGGVYPNLAKREHIKNLPILLEKTLREANEDLESPELDFIAVTTGPGLEPALWTGITFAEELGKRWNKPVVPVNHMEGHVFSVLPNLDKPLQLPALALLVSGGHTELVYIRDFGDYEVIGRTLDDAAGEAFDKVARMLGLAYPGGPKISKLAESAREKNISTDFKFPRPMLNANNLNFSFSGLKTAVLYKIKELGELDEELKEKISREFEDVVTEVLVEKTRKALEELPEVKTLIVAGGVSANLHIKKAFQSLAESYPQFSQRLSLCMPEAGLNTDNAIMIGIASYVKTVGNTEVLNDKTELKAEGNLSIDSDLW